ncbi:DUF4817 domain-containing protein [Trichonephila clavipes]|nr:DUF4817 domain-containing protein [Trichonephila clavipes]
MPKKKCALRKGVTKWPILKESVANWVLENRLNELIVTRNRVRLFPLKWSKKNVFSYYPTMKVHKGVRRVMGSCPGTTEDLACRGANQRASRKMVFSKHKEFCVRQFAKTESAITEQQAFRIKFGCQPSNDNNILSKIVHRLTGISQYAIGQISLYPVPNQCIDRKEPSDKACIAWHPRSPELPPCDFYLSGFIKDYVYVPPLPADLSD